MDTEPIKKYLEPDSKILPMAAGTAQPEVRPVGQYQVNPEYVRVLRETEWSHTRCPERHRMKVGRCTGAEWIRFFEKIKSDLGTGFLFVLIGDRGVGKTQLAVQIIHEQIEATVAQYLADPYDPIKKPSGRSGRYCEALEFFMDLKAVYASKQKSEKQVITEYAAPRVLVIDEFTVRGETKWEENLLCAILNKRYAAMKDTILIGNCAPGEVAGHLGASVVSRVCETGGVIECKWQSFRNQVRSLT